MNKNKQSRRVSSKELRAFLAGIADDICRIQDKVTLLVNGNTFEIHLQVGTINITLNEEGGQA